MGSHVLVFAWAWGVRFLWWFVTAISIVSVFYVFSNHHLQTWAASIKWWVVHLGFSFFVVCFEFFTVNAFVFGKWCCAVFQFMFPVHIGQASSLLHSVCRWFYPLYLKHLFTDTWSSTLHTIHSVFSLLWSNCLRVSGSTSITRFLVFLLVLNEYLASISPLCRFRSGFCAIIIVPCLMSSENRCNQYNALCQCVIISQLPFFYRDKVYLFSLRRH